MIPTSRTYRRAALAVLLGVAANLALAAPGDDFVDQASANGMAEIETARMALEKSKADDIRAFAQRMLDDHSKSRQELAQLAKAEKLPLSDDVTLMNKAKALILQLRDGDDFDEAYANNQVVAHEQTIDLYREYLEDGKNAGLKQFADTQLPTLEAHLQEAKQLQGKYADED
ncbi:DUF4142 domain-containing protein [Pseudomonas oligotrophica]|uniref:DUF4142 domain-containing protein n=1 Tax=Pseudomonas oligotrophica TaxID=2912055 RepID=UPI001F1B8C6A|nr:DUF4142 domain-containing protein [Pseudomonas oligotrophica]MCF7203326.1 DUF4142 domain-containing protein [Pseudomonas oligotrophica]